MRLSWNEIRARAASFARKWADAGYEKGETQSFYNEFFRIFGVRRESVARYEERVQRLDDTSGFIDLFWPGVLIVEQKSAGRDLTTAYEQAGGYFDALTESERPRYILVSDFQHFELHDLLQRDEVSFRLDELPTMSRSSVLSSGLPAEPSGIRTRRTSRPPNWSGSSTTRSGTPAIRLTTSNGSSSGSSSACSPTTRGSSSPGTSCSTFWRRGPGRTVRTSDHC